MGTEITGEAKYRRALYKVSLHLDSKTLTLRDELKLSIPLKDVRQAVSKDGQLTIAWTGDKIVLDVGAQSDRVRKRSSTRRACWRNLASKQIAPCRSSRSMISRSWRNSDGAQAL